MAAVVAMTACFPEGTPAPAYVPAQQESGALVYFKNVPTGTVKLDKGTPSVTIILERASSDLSALDVAITATGDATTYFSVPAKASFAAESKSASLIVSAKDVSSMPMNEYFDLALSIADEALTSQYGTAEFAFKLGIELPWVLFDAGVIFEDPYWGEQEEIPIYYQQITDDIRYCVVSGCFGHDTIAGGSPYDVQDYTWYWNTKTNAVYIPFQWMGYSNGNGKTWFGDESSFYNLRWGLPSTTSTNALVPLAGKVEGTTEWFEFCDAFREKYPDDYYPYYDGAGKFYLADYYTAGYPGDETYKGMYLGGDGVNDYYVCSFVADYTIGLSYEGILTDKNGVEQVLGGLTIEGDDVTDVAIVVVPGKDAIEDAADALENEASEVVNSTIVVSEAGSLRIPMIEDAEDGFYTLLAVPVSEEGYQWDFVAYESFAYGNVDPMLMDYTSADIIGGVSKEDLLGKKWIALAGGSASERAAVAEVSFAEAEDNEAGDDLITCSGLANTTNFVDTFTLEYYQGYIYTLAGQGLGNITLGETEYMIYASSFDASTGNLGGKYGAVAGYVADGIIALTSNSETANYNSFGFFGVVGNSIAGAFVTRPNLILVDPALLADAAGAPKLAVKKVSSTALKNAKKEMTLKEVILK